MSIKNQNVPLPRGTFFALKVFKVIGFQVAIFIILKN